jgi:hypothetical protein
LIKKYYPTTRREILEYQRNIEEEKKRYNLKDLRGKILLSKPGGLELASLISRPNFAFIFFLFLDRESRINFFLFIFLNLEFNSKERNSKESEERSYCRSKE